jgi:hypothetical protein
MQSLKFECPLRILCNMWKVFTRPTCASDFFLFFLTVLFKTYFDDSLLFVLCRMTVLQSDFHSEIFQCIHRQSYIGLVFDCFRLFSIIFTHSGKISALPPCKWTFGEWKAVVVAIHMLQKWNAQTFSRKAIFHTEIEAKWTSKPQNIQNFSASIPHFPAETTFWSKYFYNTDVVRG